MKNWNEIDGWFNLENEKFFQECLHEIKNKNEPKIFYEIGSWKGRSTCCMAQLIKKNEISAKLYAVDTFLGSDEEIHKKEISQLNEQGLTLFDSFTENIKECNVNDIIVPIVSTSCDASKNVDNNTIDFIYLDASHDYESVKKDIENWLPKMKRGSIMTGDDYVDCWPGVIEAVNQVFSEIGKKVDFGGYKNETNSLGTQWRVFL